MYFYAQCLIYALILWMENNTEIQFFFIFEKSATWSCWNIKKIVTNVTILCIISLKVYLDMSWVWYLLPPACRLCISALWDGGLVIWQEMHFLFSICAQLHTVISRRIATSSATGPKIRRTISTGSTTTMTRFRATKGQVTTTRRGHRLVGGQQYPWHCFIIISWDQQKTFSVGWPRELNHEFYLEIDNNTKFALRNHEERISGSYDIIILTSWRLILANHAYHKFQERSLWLYLV